MTMAIRTQWNLLLEIIFLFFFVLPFSSVSYAQPSGCSADLKGVIASVDQLVRRDFYSRKKNQYSPNSLDLVPGKTSIQGSISDNPEKSNYVASYEAVLRPSASLNHNLLGIMTLQLRSDRHMVYVCMNYEEKKPWLTHLTLYFIQAHGLPRRSADPDSDFWDDWFSGPDGLFGGSVAELTTIPVEFVLLPAASNGVNDVTGSIPLIGKLFKIPGSALGLIRGMFGQLNQLLGAGVQRIVITPTEIEFASSVDIDVPTRATILKRIPLK